MGIGKLMENDERIQHFVEVCLSDTFNRVVNEDYDLIEEICENADVTQDEMMWIFEQLGYDKSIYVEEDIEEGTSFIDNSDAMFDFHEMSKEEFLDCYPMYTEKDYDATLEEYNEKGE